MTGDNLTQMEGIEMGMDGFENYNSELKEAQLRNGTSEFRPLVILIHSVLDGLLKKDPVSFYEIVQKARNRDHVMFGKSGQVCKDISLLKPDDSMHGSIRNIILSSVAGDGLSMRLVSPVAVGE